MNDHIELKLTLLLPMQHPLLAQFCHAPLDMKNLLFAGPVDFFCRACSNKLTKQPISKFVEIPSYNWREVADNWFGSCCCSFGGISEKMVSQYIDSYGCVEGSCLLDAASVIVNKHDIEGFIQQPRLDGCSDFKEIDDKVGCAIDAKSQCRHENSAEHIPEPDLTSNCHCKVGSKNMDLPALSTKRDVDILSSPSTYSDCFVDVPRDIYPDVKKKTDLFEIIVNKNQTDHPFDNLELNVDSHSECLEKFSLDSAGWPLLNDGDHCCNNRKFSLQYSPQGLDKHVESTTSLQSEYSVIQQSHKLQHIGALRGGFLVRTSDVQKDIQWLEFSCPNCSSMLGCYPSYGSTNIPIDGGVRLFKCYISTCTPAGAPSDIFRKHTSQRVFMNLLLENAEDELSYRVFVRDLKSRSPMLQLVIISSQAWSSTGFCHENDTRVLLPAPDLQPVSKVLFSECESALVENSSTLTDWSTKIHAEEIYMMKHIIEELSSYLKSASCSLPISCSSFLGMTLSSLER